MIRRILVPLDGSSFSESALPTAAAFGGISDVELELVTVIDKAREAGTPAYDALVHESAKVYLAEVAENLRDAVARPVLRTLLKGFPAAALAGYAEESGASLMIMATHGRGPLSRAWLGSVADGLVRESPVPVVLVPTARAQPLGRLARRPPPARILVPLDGSEFSESVLGHVRMLPGVERSVLLLLRIVQYPHPVISPHAPGVSINGRETFRDEATAARDYLTELAWRLQAKGLQVESEVQVADHPARAIVANAEDNEVDLIALATHGLGGISRLVLGSVADKVVRSSEVPVLVSRPEESAVARPRPFGQTGFLRL